ncbi:MAG: hypothetical protein ACRBFS_12400 [Aureispira sp.]
MTINILKMKTTLPLHFSFLYLGSLLILFLTFCSFSSISVNQQQTPIEKKKPSIAEQKRQARLQKRYQRLHYRFETTQNSKQRLRLQKKIRTIERQQDREGTAIWGIFGMVIGILAFLIFPLLGYIIIRQSGAILLGTLSFLGFFLIALTGLLISIISLSMHKKDPASYTKKGFSIAGIIIGSIALAVLLFFCIIAFAILLP